MQRIQKLLAEAGIASRRKCEELIKQGRVKVNGTTATIGQSADPKDKITVDNKPIKIEQKITIMLNKPRGYVTTVNEKHGMKTIMDIINVKERIFPIGRLDKNSQGLLLLTNDGDLAFKLTHPKHEITKTYIVELDPPLRIPDKKKLHKGISIEGRKVQISRVRKLKPHQVLIEIHEGRKHIIRKIFEKLNYKVINLTRTAVGKIRLTNLKPGQWRHLSKEELAKLK